MNIYSYIFDNTAQFFKEFFTMNKILIIKVYKILGTVFQHHFLSFLPCTPSSSHAEINGLSLLGAFLFPVCLPVHFLIVLFYNVFYSCLLLSLPLMLLSCVFLYYFMNYNITAFISLQLSILQITMHVN
jgi:hypothetical protein